MSELAISPQSTPLDSAAVRSCIQRHFGTGGEQYAVLFEVRNGTAWHANRSVDAVVMGMWPSLGMELWGMEIKTARHDWLREMRDPGKASMVFDYFDRWFLVAPEGVAKPDELPAPWGWLVPENGTLRKARDAAKHAAAKPVDRHFLGALLRRASKTDDAFVQHAVDQALQAQRTTHQREVDRLALARMVDLRDDAQQWVKLRDALKTKPDDYLYSDDVIAAVRIILKSGITKSYDGLQSLIDQVERMQKVLAPLAKEIGIAKRKGRR